MKNTLVTIIALSISLSCLGQKRHPITYEMWLAKHDSILSDSLYTYYSGFRSDTSGSLGFRIKYFKSYNIPFEGLSTNNVLHLLGKPNDTVTVKYQGDSMQRTIFEYRIGSETIQEDSTSKYQYYVSGRTYRLLIYIVKNRAIDDFSSYATDFWTKMGQF